MSLSELKITTRQKQKWIENDPSSPYIGVDQIFQSAQICAKIAPLANWTVLDPFLDQIQNLTHLRALKIHFKILGTDMIERLCSPNLSDTLWFLESFQLYILHIFKIHFENSQT